MPSLDNAGPPMILKQLSKCAGFAVMAFTLWCVAKGISIAPPAMLSGFLVILGVFVFIVGGSGLLLFLGSYRMLAKLWIGVFAILMLVELSTLPQKIGVNLGEPSGDNPWPIVSWSAVGLTALWVAQRFVIVADEYVDRWRIRTRKVEPSVGADSR